MDAELKKKWCEALRSGKYKQAKGSAVRMKDDEIYFCALGVLYSVNGSKVITINEQTGFDLVPHIRFDKVSTRDTVIKMNDAQGKSFSEIADYIEKNE